MATLWLVEHYGTKPPTPCLFGTCMRTPSRRILALKVECNRCSSSSRSSKASLHRYCFYLVLSERTVSLAPYVVSGSDEGLMPDSPVHCC